MRPAAVSPRVVVEQVVEENVLRGQPRHVVPHVERDGLDLVIALFGVGDAKIVDRRAMASEPGADAPRSAGRQNPAPCPAASRLSSHSMIMANRAISQ